MPVLLFCMYLISHFVTQIKKLTQLYKLKYPEVCNSIDDVMKQIKKESTRLRKVADKLINRNLLILITEGCKTNQNDFLNHQTSKLSEILNLNKRLTNLKYYEDRLSKFAFLRYIFYDSFKIIFSSFIRFL